jgi:CO/xanthine dehydrogenase FAD-binding subunit
MYAFTYERPSATADAAKLVKAGGQALAGGQTRTTGRLGQDC